MRLRRSRAAPWGAGVAVLALVAGTLTALPSAQERFPHRPHQNLFPLCRGCHAGIEVDDQAEAYPEPDRCAACHDGDRVEAVEWSGPTRRASNLRFSHARHLPRITETDSPEPCGVCHRAPGAQERMAVTRPDAESCTSCHAHASLAHPDGGESCTRCHQPLVEARRLSVERIRSFPRPSSHEAEDFLSTHGPDPDVARATCATCHARPSCERCHVNADRLETVQALEPDTRVAEVVGELAAEYPTPDDHTDRRWRWRHADAASEGITDCANCHARPSCNACHEGSTSAAVAALPLPHPDGPRGVTLPDGEEGTTVHPPDFVTSHEAWAVGLEDRCASCHSEDFCTSCHAGAETPSFHPANFLESHGVRVYGSQTECVSCHSPELFCRSCHGGAGLASSGRLDSSFHSSQPFWLFAHGQAARRSLESCASCHAQNDCLRCHGPTTGFGVSPHGPGFDADRFRESAPLGCILCHTTGIPPG